MNALQSQVQQQLKKQFAFLNDPNISGTPTQKQVDNMEKIYGNPRIQRLSDKAREANLEAFNANLTENARQTGQAFMQNTAGRPIEERYEMQKEAQNAFKAQLSHLSEEQQQLALDTFNAETDVLKQADNEAGVIARTGDLLSYIPSTATKFGEQLTGLFSPDGDWRKWFTDATKQVESWRSDESKLRNYINAQNLAQAKANGELGFTQYLANAIDAPLETIGQFAESAIPTIASGVIGAAAAPVTGGASLALPFAIGGVQGAGETRNNIYDHIMEMPEAQLAQSPEYQALLTQGLSPAQARNELASSLTEHGGEILATGVSSAILNKLGGLGRIGQAGKGVLGSTTGKFVSEALTEPADEVFQQLMGNKAIHDIDPTHSLSEGLGEAAAGGLLFGVAGGGLAAADNAFRTEKTAEQAEEPVVNPESPKQSDQEQAQQTATPINSQALDEALKPYQDSEDYAEMRADLERDIEDGVIEERAKSNSQYGKLAQAYLNATGQATAEPQAESNTQEQTEIDDGTDPEMERVLNLRERMTAWRNGKKLGKIGDLLPAMMTFKNEDAKRDFVMQQAFGEVQAIAKKHGIDPADGNAMRKWLDDYVAKRKEAQTKAKQTREESYRAYDDFLSNEPLAAEPQQAVENPQNVATQAEAELQQTANTAPTAPRNVLTGTQDSVDIGENNYQPFQYEVMEADDLAPTQQKAGNQLRDRERTASQAQVNKIARNLDPRKVAESPTMDFGAPLLAQDGKTVIAGNGRSMAIRQAYAEGNADNYRQYLQQNATKFGVDGEQLAAMKNPVLVRRLNTAVDIKQTAINSNEQGGMRMSNLEQAKVDAQRLPNMAGFDLDESGDLNTPNNRGFISQFIQNQPETLRNELLDKEGKLSQTGVQRLRNAMLFQAYGDTDTLARAVESTDQGARNIINALTRIAPKVAQVKQDIANGDVNDVDISNDIVQAVEKYNQLKNQNQDVGEYLQQQDFVSELSPEAKSVLRIFNENNRSSKRIADILTSYYQTAETQGNAAQTSMFGEEEFDKAGTLEQAKNAELEENPRFSLNENSNSPFAKAVDMVAQGGNVNGYVNVGTTPSVLKMLGLPDVKVSIHGSTFKKVMGGKHQVAPETLKQLPQQINNPIAVMRSSTEPNGYVVLTELIERENGKDKPVIAALHLKQDANGLELLNIASVYGRSNAQIQRALNNDLLYWNKVKGTQFVSTFGLQLPSYVDNNSSLSARNVKTETDLSQYQNSQPGQNVNAEQNAEEAHARELLRRALGEHADKIELVRDAQFGENDARRGAEGWYHKGKLYLNLDGITDGNVLTKDERLVWVAWHELGHHGVEVQLSHALRNQLRQARKNVVVNGIAKRIFAERQAEAKRENNPSLAISQEVATEEAIVELFAAMETGNWAEIENRYRVHIVQEWRQPQSDLVKRLSHVANFFKRLVAKITGKNLDTVSNQEVLNLLATVKQGIAKSAENSTASEARYSLSEEADSDFAKAVDTVAQGGKPSQKYIPMGTTPNVLKMLGLPDTKVLINRDVLNKVMLNKHNVTAETLKQLPKQINDPVAVMKSAPQATQQGYVVLTELVEENALTGNKEPVISALHLKQTKDGVEVVNIASVYGKNLRGMQNMLNHDLLYWHKEKGSQFVESFGLQLPSKIDSETMSQSESDIKTETDLSQYQAENSEARFSRSENLTRADYDQAKANGETELDLNQWKQVRSPEFKAWFGDWENDPENASKVVNPRTGEPLVVYHGTNAEFTAFDKKKAGAGNDKGLRGKGFYLSPNRTTSESYGEKIIGAYVSLKNPFKPSEFRSADEIAEHLTNRLSEQGYEEYTVDPFIFNVGSSFSVKSQYAGTFSSILKDAGYDGVYYPHRQEVVAFEPNQIKSATDNNGEFSSENDDIRFSRAKPRSMDIDFENATPKRTANSFAQVKELAKAFLNKTLHNDETGIDAVISRANLEKMLSGKAHAKSTSLHDHLLAVANVDSLFKNAIHGWTEPYNKNDSPDVVGVHKMFAPLNIDGNVKLVKLTVKELKPEQGNRVYSVETIEIGNEKAPVPEMAELGFDSNSHRLHEGSGSNANIQSLIQRIQDFNSRDENSDTRFSRKQTAMEVLTDGKVKHETFWGTVKAGEFGKIWNEFQRKADFALTDETRPVLDWVGELELAQAQENALKADFNLVDGVRHSLNSVLMQRFLKPLHKNIATLARRKKKDIEWTKKALGIWVSANYSIQKNQELLARDEQAMQEAKQAFDDAKANGTAAEVDKAERAYIRAERQYRYRKHDVELNNWEVDEKGNFIVPRKVGVAGFSIPHAKALMAKVEETFSEKDIRYATEPLRKAVEWNIRKNRKHNRITEEQFKEYMRNLDYVPLTGDPDSLLKDDDDFIGGASSKGVNTSRDKNMKGRLNSEAEDAIDAVYRMLDKTVANAAWQPFKNGIDAVYEQKLAEAKAQGMTEEQAKQHVADTVGIRRQVMQDTTRTNDNVLIRKFGNVYYEYRLPEEVIKAIKGSQRDAEEFSVWQHFPMRQIRKLTGLYAQGVTQFKLPFAPKNMIRDIWEKSALITTRDIYDANGKPLSQKVKNRIGRSTFSVLSNPAEMKRVLSATSRLAKGDTEDLDVSNEYQRDLKELIELGGVSNYSTYLARTEKDLVKEIEKLNKPHHKVLEGAKYLTALWNGTFDYASSLAAYRALKEAGVDKKQAADITLNLTNFRKQGWAAKHFKPLYMFLNPTLQGGKNLVQMMKTRRGQVYLASRTVMAMAVWSLLMSLDDDDGPAGKRMLANGDLSREILIPTGEKDRYIRIPVGYGAPQMANNLATNLVQLANNQISVGDAVANIITHNVKSVLPIAPSEISASKDPLAKLADTLTPSLFKAQIEWLMDRSAFGATIKPNNVQRDKLLSQQSRQKTAEFWKETAEMMYEQFGIDAHPEMYKHIFDSYRGMMGSLGDYVSARIENPNRALQGKSEVVPMLNDFYGVRGENRIASQFYEYKGEAEKLKAEYEYYEGKGRLAEWKTPEKMQIVNWNEKVDSEMAKVNQKRSQLKKDEKRMKMSDEMKAKRLQDINAINDRIQQEAVYMWRKREGLATAR